MSWQAYVDSSLVGSGHIDKGAIISRAGDSVWATSPGFTVEAAEMKVIASIFEGNSAAADKAYSDGMHVGGERYVATIISTDDNIIMARKGKTGVTIVKTNMSIIIGHYGENAQAGNARSTVEALAAFMRTSNY